jgi:lipopolysaccharide transport system ATP-binding protein
MTATTSVAVRIDGLSKRYRIGAAAARHRTVRDALTHLATAPYRNLTRLRGLSAFGGADGADGDTDVVWALRDVSFQVQQGRVLGIIGRNGAGKSTLLKILSRITDPTGGRAEVFGRVGSLLEVGTGFHPDLTGRENVYLNGSILGMGRRYIDRRFDEIVDFAGVERFIDTPVKRYSSGMYLRLAFAVAAHLEPEVLVVDEVLAVGDAEFQRKCLGKIGEVARAGRTVLFVSHNMAAVSALCSEVALLEGGRLARHGPVHDVVEEYFQQLNTLEAVPLRERRDRAGDGSARLVALAITPVGSSGAIRCTSRLQVTVEYESDQPLRYPRILAGVYGASDVGIFLLDSDAVGGVSSSLPARGTLTCTTGPINVTPGRCVVNLALWQNGGMADHVASAGQFDVEAEDVHGSGKVPPREWVVNVIEHRWQSV